MYCKILWRELGGIGCMPPFSTSLNWYYMFPRFGHLGTYQHSYLPTGDPQFTVGICEGYPFYHDSRVKVHSAGSPAYTQFLEFLES